MNVSPDNYMKTNDATHEVYGFLLHFNYKPKGNKHVDTSKHLRAVTLMDNTTKKTIYPFQNIDCPQYNLNEPAPSRQRQKWEI